MGITLGYTSPTYMMCGCVWIKMDNVHRTAIWMGKINYDKQWNYRVPLSRQTNTIIFADKLGLETFEKVRNWAYTNRQFSQQIWECIVFGLKELYRGIGWYTAIDFGRPGSQWHPVWFFPLEKCYLEFQLSILVVWTAEHLICEPLKC